MRCDTMVCHPQKNHRISSVHMLLTVTLLGWIGTQSTVLLMPYPFCFPAFPFTHTISASGFGISFNYIFRDKFPKHAFLSHCPWRHPGVCAQTSPSGALKGFTFKGFEMFQQGSGNSRVLGWCQTHVSVSDSVFSQARRSNTSSQQWCSISVSFNCLSHTSESSLSLAL